MKKIIAVLTSLCMLTASSSAMTSFGSLNRFLINNETVGKGADINNDDTIDTFDIILTRKLICETFMTSSN